jgi:signal peptidase I
MTAPVERAGPRRWPTALIIVLGAPLLLATPFLLRAFVMEAFQMPSGSMEPTLAIGDHIFVSKSGTLPRRGEVIVFHYPPEPETSYVKRVIGLPGDTIAIEKNQILVNGWPIARRALSDDACSPCLWEESQGGHTYRVQHQGGRRSDFGPVQVPPDNYFVIGDNRDNSNDSRVWGSVPAKLVQGRVMFIWFSRAPDGPVRWGRMGHRVE